MKQGFSDRLWPVWIHRKGIAGGEISCQLLAEKIKSHQGMPFVFTYINHTRLNGKRSSIVGIQEMLRGCWGSMSKLNVTEKWLWCAWNRIKKKWELFENEWWGRRCVCVLSDIWWNMLTLWAFEHPPAVRVSRTTSRCFCFDPCGAKKTKAVLLWQHQSSVLYLAHTAWKGPHVEYLTLEWATVIWQ